MSKSPISEMELNSFIDGQLGPEDRNRIEGAIARDNALAQNIQELQQLKALVRDAYKIALPPKAAARMESKKPFIALAAALLLSVGAVSGWLLHSFDGSQAPLFGMASANPKGVVIQVSDNDPAKWQLALINAQNVRKAFGNAKVGIEIVAYGPGLKMLRSDSSVASELPAVAKSGVKLLACGYTMSMMHTTHAELSHLVEVVPMGIVEIMQRQKEGYAYVRP